MNHGWTEHKSPDGRTYYYHKERGVSAWEKPPEMMNAAQLSAAAISTSAWKEYTAASGKKYYFNSATRTTQWSMP
ncbi:hypothetical protein EMIHUDRAFT_75318, partial [Emiliania huxleyi CCMP1516]|uniref:WW domain-containing protein n=5 Tax=Emiliania huxleyi TaxID=2903 RepID=A0A0D3J8M3_EMIH1